MIKMTRNDARNLSYVLKLMKDVKHTKLGYLVLKNTKVIDSEMILVQELYEKNIPERFKEYEDKRVELAEKYCKRDENGNPLSENKSYVFEDESMKLFNEDMMKLSSEYADALSESEKNIQNINNMLMEEYEFDLMKIKKSNFNIDDLPNNLSAYEIELFEKYSVEE